MRAAIVALAMVLPLPATAQTSPVARELSTDRPDKTESPYTVPNGRIQIEMDFANYIRDHGDDVRVETIGAVPFNLKLGIDDGTDLQLVIAPYIHRTATDSRSGARTTTEGFGDVTVRLKRNLWGDNGGTTAFALMPYVTLPTSRAGLGTGKVDFGLIAPLAIKLSNAIDLGLMTEIDAAEDSGGRGRNVSFVNSATLGFSLTERLGLYTELFTEMLTGWGERWIVTGDLGVTYAIGTDTQVDAGVNLGLNDAADDAAIFVGLSRRF